MQKTIDNKFIKSHPSLIKAIIQELKNNGVDFDKNRITSVGTKTGNVVVSFTSDFDKHVHTVRLKRTLEYTRTQDINYIVNKILLEINEDPIK